MPPTIQAHQADRQTIYFTAEHGAAVRVGEANIDGILIENVDTGARIRVGGAYPLLTEQPTEADLITSTVDPTKPVPDKPKKAKKAKKAKRLGHATTLHTNIQGGVEIEFPGRLVLLHGSNGSHKTTIVRGLELAGTAKASDVAGRGVTSKESMLIPLIDPAVDNTIMAAMQVHLPATDTEVECVYTAKVKDAKHASKAVHSTSGIKVVFPLREVHEHLRGSPEKAQAWLLQTACGNLDRAAVLARLSDKATTLFPALVNKGTPIVDSLLAAVKEAPGRARMAKRKSDAALQEADRLAMGLAPPASEEQIEELREASESSDWILDQAIADEAATNAVASVQQIDRDASQARLRALQEDVADRVDPRLTQALAAQTRFKPDSDHEQKQIDRNAAIRLIQTSLAKGTDHCLFCAGTLPREVQGTILSGLQQQVGAAIELAADYTRWTEQVSVLTQTRGTLEAEYNRIQASLQATPAASQEVADLSGCNVSVLDARAVASLARKNHDNAVDRTASWKRSRSARADSEMHAQDQRTYESLAKDLQATVAWAVDEAADTFVARVQALLPADDVFWLDARTGRYGLVKAVTDAEGHPIRHRRDSALCGAEWARVTMALAGASTPADADLAILVPEDRAWDPKTLRATMQGLVKYPGMVVITTTIKPYRGAPKGWHMIDTDEL
ncbi:MAG TPA: hypothetical protein EYF98_00815 [Planctomycetes bacterium]|nr:hypothetical protein [Planctomycetota bacterium]